MRIVMINRLMGISRGGGENFDLNMARTLRELGCDVSFLAGRRWRGVDFPLDEFPTTYVRTPYFRNLHYRWHDRSNRILRGLGNRALWYDIGLFERAAMRSIARMEQHPDVFQICGLPRLATWITARFNVRSVVRWPGPPSLPVRKWTAGYAANIANGDALIHARRDLPAEVHDIPPGVDGERFHPGRADALRAKHDLTEDNIVVLFVGRLVPIKNLPFLLEGFAKAYQSCSKLRLLLVGNGDDKEALQHQARESGITEAVVFAGQQSGDALGEYYRMADLFAITSHYDNFPNVVLEAMSSGLPIVGTRVGGIPLQVEDGLNGYLVDAGDVETLQTRLYELATHPEERNYMGQANRTKVEQAYSWLESGRNLKMLYTQDK